MIHRVSGACASHLEWRGAGCYILYCRSEADLALVRGIHKRVLFDVGGVWLARTAEEIDALCEYVALEAPVLSRKAHLPRDSMVVEEHRVDVAGPAGGRHHPMMVAGQHPRVVMPYPTGLLPQGQDLSSVYTSYPSYSSPYPAPYRPFLSQIALPNPTELPPPPPYSS
ncbi:unnamed protein product [Phytomonas sp. EM1]|nr:unnamed protein product [Phytomonas sp. EM1]|eukprot:CCW60999.1 unnamed protein product [Phytomonas sp. isolate EM1]